MSFSMVINKDITLMSIFSDDITAIQSLEQYR